ncbi:MAG: hypothetical protein FWF22_02660, partial [Treponema sp.]|nr:hypothetical protein [Treponema sp.]
MASKFIRPVIYKVIPRLAIGLALSLLWDRYINVQKLYSMTKYAFFIFGILFLALAWVSYLRLDGVRLHFLNKKYDNQRKKKHIFKFMTDYSTEEPTPLDSLDENEEMKANLYANIITGLLFLLPSVVLIIS